MRGTDSSFPEMDLRSVRDALVLRWWIIPLVMLLCVGFLFVNESDLQTSPGHVQIVRVYEARDESAALAVAGIDPASIVPYPSFDNQLIVLQTPETRRRIADSINADTTVSVSRSKETFSLIDTNEGEGKKKFTFLSVGTLSYTFTCAEPTADECNIAIDAYVAEISRLRAQSIQQGFERAETIVNALTDSSQGEAQALAIGKKLVTGEMVLLSTTSENIGPTVDTVNASTYGFGLGVGALLGLLIVLQLSVSDKKIRTRRKLVAIVGEKLALGIIRPDARDSSSQHVAAGLIHQMSLHGATSVRLLSIGDNDNDSSVTALKQAVSGNSITVAALASVEHLTATELLPPPHSVVVLMADSNTSRSDELERVRAIAEHAGNSIVGVILVQH
ncbi:MAG: hypothetical protein ABIQ38_02585 [Ilumatobacteraceae bacterium]